jgi:hypothetical protein
MGTARRKTVKIVGAKAERTGGGGASCAAAVSGRTAARIAAEARIE